MNIVQVVRRFGPVGGMERYVWELTRELAAAGHHLHVLCESDLSEQSIGDVTIHLLKKARPKPRWLAHMNFSRRVHEWLMQNGSAEMIIHSHERLHDHHITTFHGPPFAQIYALPLWKRLSLRCQMNLWLEKREVATPSVRIVVPNSIFIAKELRNYYPFIADRLSDPIVPGVSPSPQRPQRHVPADGGVIGFVGKEWRRKGLEQAIATVEQMTETRPNLKFLVAGPEPKAVQHLFGNTAVNYTLLGETGTAELYPQLDLLIHPAAKEPFGMVITESLGAGVPVLVSDVCGAATEVADSCGRVLPLEAPTEQWASAANEILSRPEHRVSYHRSWQDVAQEYARLYASISPQCTDNH